MMDHFFKFESEKVLPGGNGEKGIVMFASNENLVTQPGKVGSGWLINKSEILVTKLSQVKLKHASCEN